MFKSKHVVILLMNHLLLNHIAAPYRNCTLTIQDKYYDFLIFHFLDKY